MSWKLKRKVMRMPSCLFVDVLSLLYAIKLLFACTKHERASARKEKS
jgi:hypothetical protein